MVLWSMLFVIFLALGDVRLVQGQTSNPDVMTREARTQAAQAALAEGDYATVIEQANELLERWPRDENALILKAAALLFGPSVDAAEAGRLLRKLPRDRRKDADVEALDLWKDYRYGSSFMPTVRERLQLGRAKELLEADPSDPIANLVVGMLRLEDQRALDNAVRLTLGVGMGDISEMLFYEATAVLDRSTGQIAFRSDRGADDIMVLRNDDPMHEVSENAIRALIRASARGPLRSVAVRYMTEATIRGGRVRDGEFLLKEYVSMYPESSRGHLLLGLLNYMLINDQQAEEAFEQALNLMDEEDRHPWLNPQSVVSTEVASGYREVTDAEMNDFWIRQDREWSRPGNERRTEHMGRMAYADVIWGRPELDMRGWETEPGQVLIRYGFPEARLQFQTGSEINQQGGDRFHILHYGNRYWIFQDLAKAGKPIFYSPPADHYQGGRAIVASDWALQAKEQFRDNPLESDLETLGKLTLEVLPSVFEDEEGRTVIAPICIKGAAFSRGDSLQTFDRLVGAPVPPASGTSPILNASGCPSALAVMNTDGRARQFSLEIRDGDFWSVGRFDIAEAEQDARSMRASDILFADLIVEHDATEPIPEGMLVRNDLLIRPVAEPRTNRGMAINLYAEVYGLDHREGGELAIEAILAEGGSASVGSSFLGRLFRSRDDAAVSVAFVDEIHSNSHGRPLILETEDLEPGLYTIAIRFTERASGRQIVARREIRID